MTIDIDVKMFRVAMIAVAVIAYPVCGIFSARRMFARYVHGSHLSIPVSVAQLCATCWVVLWPLPTLLWFVSNITGIVFLKLVAPKEYVVPTGVSRENDDLTLFLSSLGGALVLVAAVIGAIAGIVATVAG